MTVWSRYPGAQPTRFGDSPDLSARLLSLIASGAKTATCGALAHYHEDGDPLPEAGQIIVALDHAGHPALVYEVTEVAIRPFRDIPEDFALAEGEGDFDDWRAGHIDYFTRNGGFDPDMPIVCERLRLIEVLEGGRCG
ncbi:ASCH domain-containing protein [Paracoccus sp. p4-l81]|uniref:ASCH domain-containing protein n=1 Tax=unclassified Paracoccus (in: a-proteobacteria) TaxID=2688777 RepID=UPI0035B6C05C